MMRAALFLSAIWRRVVLVRRRGATESRARGTGCSTILFRRSGRRTPTVNRRPQNSVGSTLRQLPVAGTRCWLRGLLSLPITTCRLWSVARVGQVAEHGGYLQRRQVDRRRGDGKSGGRRTESQVEYDMRRGWESAAIKLRDIEGDS
jgi:hypothetical protein